MVQGQRFPFYATAEFLLVTACRYTAVIATFVFNA